MLTAARCVTAPVSPSSATPPSPAKVVSLRRIQKSGTSHGNLVLARKPGQSIVIHLPDGQKIIVRVGDASGSRVSLGILAPRNIRVMREEAVDREDADSAKVVSEILASAELEPVGCAVSAGGVEEVAPF